MFPLLLPTRSRSLAMGAVPSLIFFFGSMLLPDTPNSLVQRGRPEDGRAVLQKIRGTAQVTVEFDDICEAVRISKSAKNPWRTITQRRYWPQLIISIMVPIFQQLTGINAIMFYAPQLFQAAGHSAESALLSTVITGAVNMGSTFVALILVDRIGRRVSAQCDDGDRLLAKRSNQLKSVQLNMPHRMPTVGVASCVTCKPCKQLA
jgi:MFS family permease